MKIISINYNWGYSPENGPEFISQKVGENEVVEIKEHSAQGEGDKWYYDISYSNGLVERIFNPNQVFFEKDE